MAPVSLDQLPPAARQAWISLAAELHRILADDLVAAWAHGGTTSVAEEPHPADLDTYVILARPPSPSSVEAIEAAHQALAREHGVEWDAWYVLESDARGADPPRHAFRRGSRDTSWAIQRAHWLAGRYVPLHGPAPDEIVQAPTEDELMTDLRRELEHIERHVLEGDTDPYEATYAILNGSRILHTLETGNAALSKAAAGRWALGRLPNRWHPALQAATRAYRGHASREDTELLAAEMGSFVAFVRERLPLLDEREADELPRWSGY